MSTHTWAARTMVNSQTQHLPDGVAIEHMIDLINITGVRSVWFSFPLNSGKIIRMHVHIFLIECKYFLSNR